MQKHNHYLNASRAKLCTQTDLDQINNKQTVKKSEIMKIKQNTNSSAT